MDELFEHYVWLVCEPNYDGGGPDSVNKVLAVCLEEYDAQRVKTLSPAHISLDIHKAPLVSFK